MLLVFSFFFAAFFFLWKPVETVGNGGSLRLVSQGLGAALEDPCELGLHELGQHQGVEGIAPPLQFGDARVVQRGGSAGAEPLQRGLRRLVAPAKTGTDAELAIELDPAGRGKKRFGKRRSSLR